MFDLDFQVHSIKIEFFHYHRWITWPRKHTHAKCFQKIQTGKQKSRGWYPLRRFRLAKYLRRPRVNIETMHNNLKIGNFQTASILDCTIKIFDYFKQYAKWTFPLVSPLSFIIALFRNSLKDFLMTAASPDLSLPTFLCRNRKRRHRFAILFEYAFNFHNFASILILVFICLFFIIIILMSITNGITN